MISLLVSSFRAAAQLCPMRRRPEMKTYSIMNELYVTFVDAAEVCGDGGPVRNRLPGVRPSVCPSVRPLARLKSSNVLARWTTLPANDITHQHVDIYAT